MRCTLLFEPRRWRVARVSVHGRLRRYCGAGVKVMACSASDRKCRRNSVSSLTLVGRLGPPRGPPLTTSTLRSASRVARAPRSRATPTLHPRTLSVIDHSFYCVVELAALISQLPEGSPMRITTVNHVACGAEVVEPGAMKAPVHPFTGTWHSRSWRWYSSGCCSCPHRLQRRDSEGTYWG
jgi:hypothetical protein